MALSGESGPLSSMSARRLRFTRTQRVASTVAKTSVRWSMRTRIGKKNPSESPQVTYKICRRISVARDVNSNNFLNFPDHGARSAASAMEIAPIRNERIRFGMHWTGRPSGGRVPRSARADNLSRLLSPSIWDR